MPDKLNIRDAYVTAFSREADPTSGRKAFRAVWQKDLPPPAVELAALRYVAKTSVEREKKLKEFALLGEQQVFGPGGTPVSISSDPQFRRIVNRIRPKLKEMTLSDQAFAVAEINRIVWEALKPNLIFREFVNVLHTTKPIYRFPRAILIPRAFDIQEGQEIPIAGEKYDIIDTTMRKTGIRPMISRESVEDMEWDVIARQLAEGGRAMAQKENEIGLSIFTTAGTSNNNFQGYTTTVDAASHGSLAYADTVNAISALRAKNAFPDTLGVHPTEEGNLLNDDKFIHTFYFGGLMKKALGPPEYFGQILGFRTLTSTLLTQGTSLMLDTARAAGFVIRRDVTVENIVDPQRDVTGAAFTERFNLAILRSDAVCAITNT